MSSRQRDELLHIRVGVKKKTNMWFGATYKMSTIHGEASMSTRCQRNFVLKILLIKALLDFFKLFPRDFGDSIIYGSIP